MKLGSILLFFLSLALVMGQPADQDRINLMVEALSRLEPDQVHTNPKLKEALLKVLDATRGTPKFVELVRKFQIKDQNQALLATTLNVADETARADALRLLLENQGAVLLRTMLRGTNVAGAIRIAEACGNVGGNQIVPLLEPVVSDPKRDSALRKRAVQALAKTQEGSTFLLKLAYDDKLGADIKLTAATELNHSRWPNIRAEASKALPLPQSRNAQPFPPITDLAKMKGDASRGAEVFSRPDVACINCHQVNGKGIDYGPKLSEIGAKLAKEAFYEAILDPSAGISFGYEGWQIQLKNGDEAIGLIVSETNDEIALKAQTGIVTQYQKAEIVKREGMKTSVMPVGLQQALTVQDLVDLVEYLVSLKKASN